ncbi:MAG: hypothetical protein V7K65_09670 [Nostoc sp.]
MAKPLVELRLRYGGIVSRHLTLSSLKSPDPPTRLAPLLGETPVKAVAPLLTLPQPNTCRKMPERQQRLL